MKAIIDTHTYICYINGDNRLSPKAFEIVDDRRNDIFISSASIWELSIKIKLGKLKIISNFENIEHDLRDLHISVLYIAMNDILQNYNLPFYHRDPFDRIIISQSLTKELPIIGCDELFDNYNVDRIW